MKKIFIVGALNVLLVAVQFGLAMGRSSDGAWMAGMAADLAKLKIENEQLAQQIYAKSSLTYIASRSVELGLVDTQVKFVNDASVAVAQLVP